MKKKLIKILIKAICLLDKQETKSLVVDLDLNWKGSKVIPKDGNWHKVCVSLEYWIKRDEEDLKFDSIKSYLDGGKIESEYTFNSAIGDL